MSKDIYIVYKITNVINKKEYIGFHKCKNGNVNDGYMGSGKLIIKALEFYGKEYFTKEILKEFNNKEDAEAYEKELVNIDYVLRKDTYNLSTGGNVTILYGKNNGFYGRKHTKESIDKIQKKRTKTIKERGYTRLYKLAFYIDDELFPTRSKIRDYLLLNDHIASQKEIIKFIIENDLILFNSELRPKLEKVYENILKHEQYMKELRAKRTSQMFKNIPKSEEHKRKIGLAHKNTKKAWVSNIINKNPDKIRKTAEKHKGSKRTTETCSNISKAIKEKYNNGFITGTKGKSCYYNKELDQLKYFSKDEHIPDGWIKGNPKVKKNG